MATITLPVYTEAGIVNRQFEMRDLSFAASILDQCKGARKEWRRIVTNLKFPSQAVESDAVLEWNQQRAEFKEFNHQDDSYHGIRKLHRALQGDPWAMIDKPEEGPTPESLEPMRRYLFTDEQATPGSDDY